MRRDDGFTLIELMIVVAIIAILASLAVPSLLASGAVANENTTVATLRTISTAQFRFKAMSLVDRDHSGSFEYGTLPELSGVAIVRQSAESLSPGLLASSFGVTDANGFVRRQGYYFAVFLPDAAGTGLVASPANLGSVDPRNAEIAYTLLAWPASYGHSGRVTFFVNEQGEILKTLTARYSGVDRVPPAGAALTGVPPTTIVGGRLAVGVTGADGNTWLPVR